VLDAHESGRQLRDQAVLVRAAHHSDVLEVELSARGIPFVKFGGLRFTEAAHVKDFLAAARVVANPADDIGWFRVLRLHEGIGPTQRAADRRRPPAGRPVPPWKRWPARGRGRSGAGPRERGVGYGDGASSARPPWTAPRTRPVAILAALVGPLRARYPDAGPRIADLERPRRRRGEPGPRCTRRWSSWRSTRRCPARDLAGPAAAGR